MHATVHKGHVPGTRCSALPRKRWWCSYLLGIMSDSTVVLNLNVMYEEQILFYFSCAFSLLLSFLISSADSQCPWRAHGGFMAVIEPAAKPRLLDLISVFVNFLCCIWTWGFKDFSKQRHCFRNQIQLCGIRKTCIQSTFLMLQR